jgi:hypothetical protein
MDIETGNTQMTYAIYEIAGARKSKLNAAPEFSTIEDAVNFVNDKFAKVLAFIDHDEAEDAYDFITTIGGQYAIEAVRA